jgi:sugar/nucleoside kinase (ribokinase family)
MAGVFLSYARDDTPKARQIASALEKNGHSVWCDLHVRGGTQFSKVIEEALKAADVVVVLWSERAVESPWVRDEAAAGRDTGRLVPVSLDGTQAPLGFGQYQTIDVSSWRGRGKPAAFQKLLDAIESAGNPAMVSVPAASRRERPSDSPTACWSSASACRLSSRRWACSVSRAASWSARRAARA